MSDRFVVVLGLAVLAVLSARLFVPGIPLRSRAGTTTGPDLALLALGVAGLVFHCGAMFFRSTFTHLPGSETPIAQITAMGGPSRIWFAIPAVLVVLALRRRPRIAVALVALALAAVGLTMYDAGPLRLHLTAIFVAALAIAAVVSLLMTFNGLNPDQPSR